MEYQRNHTPSGVWVLAHCWVLEQQATTTKTPRVGVVWCGCFSSVPDLIQHVTVFGGVVGGCGVVVWLLHSGREHLVRMTPLFGGVVFMYVIFSTRHNHCFHSFGLLVVWVVFCCS